MTGVSSIGILEAIANAELIVRLLNFAEAGGATILKTLAAIPIEDFGYGAHKPDQPLTAFNGAYIYVRDVLSARKALNILNGETTP